MEAICPSETPFDTQRTTRRHIPEPDAFHNHRCENLKSYTVLVLLKLGAPSDEGLGLSFVIVFVCLLSLKFNIYKFICIKDNLYNL
jgi:hypothetical protein